MSGKLINISFFIRNSKSGFSIEKVFKPIIALNQKHSKVYYAPCHKADIISILKNLIFVRKNRNKAGINHMTGGPQYFTIALKDCKNVLTIHDLVLLDQYKGWKRSLFRYFWFSLPLKYASAITCISETTRLRLLKEFNLSPEKVCTIYNPIEDSYKPNPKIFNNNYPTILHIGTAWNKNLERTIEAIKTISCRYVIIGEVDDLIIQKMKDFNIDFVIKKNLSDEELYNEYCKCDIVSFPSIYEGFGMPIIEGQAIGRPVLTSDINPMKEISHNAACLVNPNDIGSIRDGFLKIIQQEDYRQELIEKGFQNAKKFSATIINEQYSKIYKSLL